MNFSARNVGQIINNWKPSDLVKPEEQYWVMPKGTIRDFEISQSGYRATIVIPFDSSHSWIEVEALIDIDVSTDEVKWRVWGDCHLLSEDRVEEFIADVEVGLIELAKQISKQVSKGNELYVER